MEGLAVKKKTVADYRALPEGSLYQLIEGELIMTPAPKLIHQDIARNLVRTFLDFLKENPVGKVYFAPVDIYFNNENVYQPDIVFISKDRLHILKEDGVYGAPDLIIEILSPATAYYDLRIKFKVYEQHGVKEYWIVDPELKEMEIYQLQNNKFVFVEKAEKEAKIKSTLLSGLEVGLKDVFV